MYVNPEELRNMPQYKPQTPVEWAELARCHANSASTKALAELQVFRGAELRRNRTEINLHTRRNCEAALTYSRGHVMRDNQACRYCRRGCGPFDKCVVMPGYMKGSCTNCHYNGEGSHCSFRFFDSTNEEEVPALNFPQAQETSGDIASLHSPIVRVDLTNTEFVHEAHQTLNSGVQVAAKADLNWIAQNAHKAATRRKLARVLNQMADLFEVT